VRRSRRQLSLRATYWTESRATPCWLTVLRFGDDDSVVKDGLMQGILTKLDHLCISAIEQTEKGHT
jgi:hypothetical protein